MTTNMGVKSKIIEVSNGNTRSADAVCSIDNDGWVVLVYEASNGASRTIKIPRDTVTAALQTPSTKPTITELYTAEDHAGSRRRFGPFTRRETAVEVAKGRGEWGGDGGVTAAKHVVWTEPDGTMMGVATLGQPIRVSTAAPADAAVEAVLGSLDPAQRAVMEAALARR